MKCCNCGNETYIDIKLDSKDITMKACTKCGHLEYFYRMDKVKYLTEIDILNTQSEALEIIATNEYQTVKAQKEAEEKMKELNEAYENGVEILVYKCNNSLNGIKLISKPLDFDLSDLCLVDL